MQQSFIQGPMHVEVAFPIKSTSSNQNTSVTPEEQKKFSSPVTYSQK